MRRKRRFASSSLDAVDSAEVRVAPQGESQHNKDTLIEMIEVEESSAHRDLDAEGLRKLRLCKNHRRSDH